MSRFKRLALTAAIAVAVVSALTPPEARAVDTATAGQTVAAGGAAVKDGTWAGSRVHTFYGYLQVEAVTSGGTLTEVRVPEYPAHDGTSRRINTIALPHLVKSAVLSGGAEVDADVRSDDNEQGLRQVPRGGAGRSGTMSAVLALEAARAGGSGRVRPPRRRASRLSRGFSTGPPCTGWSFFTLSSCCSAQSL